MIHLTIASSLSNRSWPNPNLCATSIGYTFLVGGVCKKGVKLGKIYILQHAS